MKVAVTLFALPALGWAFPGLDVSSREKMLSVLEQKRAADPQNNNVVDVVEDTLNDAGLGVAGNVKGKRQNNNIVDVLENTLDDAGLGVAGNVKDKREPQLLGGLLGTVGDLLDDIAGLTSALATTVDPDNLRPEPGYEFIAPGPGDSRGPCPGLNLLANYGYLPRNGNVTFAEVVAATNRGFNMGADLSTVLAVFAILTDGDIATESWWLGQAPDGVGGLVRHSTVECDVSPTREDYYLGCGDNHHLSSRLFTQMVGCASNSSAKDFGIDTQICQYDQSAKFSQTYNPYLYYFPFPSIVSLGAFAFYPNFFSNGTYGQGGVANYESISSIIGAQLNKDTGHFEYVPEKWPENWYRRSDAYGAVQTLADGFLTIYPTFPLPMPIPQLGSPNLNVSTILCDVVLGITTVTPYMLSATTEEAEAAVSWATAKLGLVGLTAEILGCPTSALSPVYPNGTTALGGPLNPPPAVVANTGNDVFNKVYFVDPPYTPECNAVSSS